MAQATWIPNSMPTPPPNVINLALTLREAEVLKAVMGGIAGHIGGPQEKTMNIFWALANAGVGASTALTLTSPIYLNELKGV